MLNFHEEHSILFYMLLFIRIPIPKRYAYPTTFSPILFKPKCPYILVFGSLNNFPLNTQCGMVLPTFAELKIIHSSDKIVYLLLSRDRRCATDLPRRYTIFEDFCPQLRLEACDHF